ncbi:hypothetical protein KM043_004587 [Ampulex compressa]|nr:hypothetical protein KM043_004587 [Ampulex compressa]
MKTTSGEGSGGVMGKARMEEEEEEEEESLAGEEWKNRGGKARIAADVILTSYVPTALCIINKALSATKTRFKEGPELSARFQVLLYYKSTDDVSSLLDLSTVDPKRPKLWHSQSHREIQKQSFLRKSKPLPTARPPFLESVSAGRKSAR